MTNEAYFFGDHVSGSFIYQPSVTSVVVIRVYLSEATGTTTLSLNCSAAVPRQLWIEDVGPRVL
jgi:hypothetical protein